MSPHSGRPTSQPCVLVVVDERHACDPIGLVDALGHPDPLLTVGAWCPDPDAPPHATVRHSATVLDDLERWSGRRPRYDELGGPLPVAVDGWVRAAKPTLERLVVVGAGHSPRQIRRVRRALLDTGVHLAIAPVRADRPGLVTT